MNFGRCACHQHAVVMLQLSATLHAISSRCVLPGFLVSVHVYACNFLTLQFHSSTLLYMVYMQRSKH